MSADPSARLYVQSIFAKVPVWLTRANGRRFLWSMILVLDLGVRVLEESFYARFPGLGTPTALPLIGQSRGMIRGMTDTDASFAAHLIQWLDRWRLAGGMPALARAIQEYAGGNPRVKIVNRAGRMLDLAAGGASYTVSNVTWNWDSLSHPKRAGYWSELWVIVYAPPWPIGGTMGVTDPTNFGLGQQVPRVDVDAIKGLLAQWKSAHSYVRAVIWSYDATLFDPTSSSTMPDGTWGSWSYGSIHCALSGRGVLEQANRIRTWEPEREPPENLLGAS